MAKQKKMTQAEALEVLKQMMKIRQRHAEFLKGIQSPAVRATRRNTQKQISALELAIEALTPD